MTDTTNGLYTLTEWIKLQEKDRKNDFLHTFAEDAMPIVF